MAKVLGPLHSSEARGRMGGLVYNSWRGAATVKAKHAPSQPRTVLQLAVRAVAIHCSRAWQALADPGAWNTYATAHPLVDWTGSTKRLTGSNWYVMLTTRLLRLGIAPVVTPPVAAAPDPVETFTAVGGAGSITVDWTQPTAHTNSVELWWDGPHSAGRQGSFPRARYQGAPWGDEGGLVLSGLQPGVYTLYARVLGRSDGQVSLFVSAVATVN
ncbi:MAG: hypothetical protein WCK89_20180 [bacterium]